jgi:hypothetical protein
VDREEEAVGVDVNDRHAASCDHSLPLSLTLAHRQHARRVGRTLL